MSAIYVKQGVVSFTPFPFRLSVCHFCDPQQAPNFGGLRLQPFGLRSTALTVEYECPQLSLLIVISDLETRSHGPIYIIPC